MRARSTKAKEQRRQAFLDAALDEFFERGFASARMDDIARRAGFSKGALYLYFESKEALFAALVQTIAIPGIEQIEARAAAAPTASDALRAIIRFAPHMIRSTAIPRIVKILVGDGARFPALAQAYRRDVIERGMALIVAIVQRGGKAGEFAVAEPALTARLVIAPMVLSAIWHVLFEQEPEARVDLDALFRLHETLMLRALAAGGDGAAP